MTGNSLIGKKLGKYEVRELLGQGGMATVYLGYQSDIDRFVAIKILPPHPGQDPQFIDRFQQEARTIARLQHPHILPVYDFGTEDNILYLVMPYIQGGSLTQMMGNQSMAPQQVAQILRYVGSAVDYAHRQGIIHRDIKPDNILLDQEGHPILSDFGIAKLVEGNMQFTASGGFLGTPAYMAPEQGQGLANIDGRVDIYALGVVAFEMLTGRHPYQAETPMMVMFKHISDPVPSLLEVDSNYPVNLDLVLRRALAKDPMDRYGTAMEFAENFQSAISGTGKHDTQVPPTRNIEGATVIRKAPTNPAENPGTLIVNTSSDRATLPPTQRTMQGDVPERSNNLLYGGAVLAALMVVAIAAFLLMGGDDDDNGSVADAPTHTATAAETMTLTPTDTPLATTTLDPANLSGSINVGNAAILLAPDRNAEQVARGLDGDEVTILGQTTTESGERFYLVQLGDLTGWILDRQLDVREDVIEIAQVITLTPTNTPSSTPTETPTSTPTPTETPTETFTPTITPTDTPLPTQTFTPSPTPIPSFGKVEFRSTNIAGDTAVVEVIGIAPPRAGQHYIVWLVNTADSAWLSLGELPVNVDGDGVITYVSPAQEPIFLEYDAVALSLEPSDTLPDSPAGEFVYSGFLPSEVSSALQQLLIAWTPEDASINSGGSSLIVIAQQEYQTGADHAGFALNDASRSNAAGVRTHSEHVYNILNGLVEDINADGSGSNPSSLKIGLLPVLNTIYDLLTQATLAEDASIELQAQIVKVQTCAGNALIWTEQAVETARELANTQDAAAALSDIEAWNALILPINPGADSNEDGVIQPVEGECAIASIPEFAVFMNYIPLQQGLDPRLESAIPAQ